MSVIEAYLEVWKDSTMKIAVYGVGMVEKVLSFSLRKENEIVIWVDGNEKLRGEILEGTSSSYTIDSAEKLKDNDFDILLLAVVGGWMDARDRCLAMGIEERQIILAEVGRERNTM